MPLILGKHRDLLGGGLEPDHGHAAIHRGKVKRLGRFTGKRADWKKAIVTLAEGDSIDLFDQV